jgi:hypothetical protein
MIPQGFTKVGDKRWRWFEAARVVESLRVMLLRCAGRRDGYGNRKRQSKAGADDYQKTCVDADAGGRCCAIVSYSKIWSSTICGRSDRGVPESVLSGL